jgi:hypothetical protein
MITIKNHISFFVAAVGCNFVTRISMKIAFYQSPSDPDSTRFGKLQMGLNANKVIVKKEDKVKLKIDRLLVPVEISHFLIRQALPPNQVKFSHRGKNLIHLIHQNLFI